MKTIQCTHPPHHHNGFVATCQLWTASGRVHTLLVLDCLCSFLLLAQCLLSTLLVLTLAMRELRHWPSIAGMSPKSHCGDEEDERIIVFMTLLYIYIYIYILYIIYIIYIYVCVCMRAHACVSVCVSVCVIHWSRLLHTYCSQLHKQWFIKVLSSVATWSLGLQSSLCKMFSVQKVDLTLWVLSIRFQFFNSTSNMRWICTHSELLLNICGSCLLLWLRKAKNVRNYLKDFTNNFLHYNPLFILA